MKRRIFIILGVLFALLLISLSFATPPSDAKLVKHFHAHREPLEQLRAMLQADQDIHHVLDDRVATMTSIVPRPARDVGVSEERFREYLALMKRAKVSSAIHDGDDFRFPVAGWGFASEGWRIAITWRESEPKNQIASLDEFRKTGTAWKQAYRHLEGDWYLWIIW